MGRGAASEEPDQRREDVLLHERERQARLHDPTQHRDDAVNRHRLKRGAVLRPGTGRREQLAVLAHTPRGDAGDAGEALVGLERAEERVHREALQLLVRRD